jgi:hypothetical protein
METSENKKPYEWDFDGACDPNKHPEWSSASTFSVGCFQWIPRSSKKGLKRGRVEHRVRGFVSNPEEVYARARAYCAKMNATETNKDNAANS